MARKKNSSTAETKLKILKSAIKNFGTSGVHNTKMALIAQEAKVEPPMINYYYPNFDSLLKDVVEYILEHMNTNAFKAFETDINKPLNALENYIRAYFQWSDKNRHMLSVWIYFYHVTCYDKRFSQVNKSVRDFGKDRISLILYKAIDSGEIKLKKNWKVEDLALTIQSMITGNCIMAITEESGDFSQMCEYTIKVLHELIKSN